MSKSGGDNIPFIITCSNRKSFRKFTTR